MLSLSNSPASTPNLHSLVPAMHAGHVHHQKKLLRDSATSVKPSTPKARVSEWLTSCRFIRWQARGCSKLGSTSVDLSSIRE
uniref:Uncharacterized protein n=1 Tax=Trichuris muris TaxID=70415 RepID=A0A5S6QND4_TRIMR